MNEVFYERCATLLGAKHEGTAFPYSKRTRWNNRKPGIGRYPGFGLIRHYGDVIHVMLTNPVTHNKVYNNEDDVYDFLKGLIMEQFEITSGKIRVTDPCYSKDTWCTGVIENARNGKWNAIHDVRGEEETEWGDRVCSLTIVHEDFDYIHPGLWEKTEIHAGVDSGQCGFFDDENYPDVDKTLTWEQERNSDREKWRWEQFENTVSEDVWGSERMFTDADIEEMIEEGDSPLLKSVGVDKFREIYQNSMTSTHHREYNGIANAGFGVSTSSGYGDGGYDVFVVKEDDEVIAAKLIYIYMPGDPGYEEYNILDEC